MLIACPSCSAEYQVPDRLLAGPARMLRCSRCAAEFALPGTDSANPAPVVPAAPAPEAEPPASVDPAPVIRAPMPMAPRIAPDPPAAAVPVGDPTALRRAWAASIAALVVGAGALVVYRAAVIEAWPPAARFFLAIGLT